MEVWQRGLLLGIANPPIHAIMYPLVQIQPLPPRERDVIGSRIGLKIRWDYSRGGSTPPAPISC